MTDVFTFCCCHILGHIHQDRARAAAFCYGKSFADGVGKLCHIFYNVAVFRHRHYDSCDVHLLEGILSKKCGPHITGDGYHRNRVHAGCCDSSYQVGCSRAGSSQTYSHLAGCTGIAVCCVGGSLFMGSKYMFDFITISVKGVINIQDCTARIAKNGIHTLLQ